MRDRQTTHNLKQRFQFVANLSLFISLKRRSQSPPRSPMVEEAVPDEVAELLRLRVRETWQLYGNAQWVRKCQLSQVSVTVVNKC